MECTNLVDPHQLLCPWFTVIFVLFCIYTPDNQFPRPIVKQGRDLFWILLDSNMSFDGQSSFPRGLSNMVPLWQRFDICSPVVFIPTMWLKKTFNSKQQVNKYEDLDLSHSLPATVASSDPVCNCVGARRVWGYQRDTQNSYIEGKQTKQWPKLFDN
jgi:hypothetical protein